MGLHVSGIVCSPGSESDPVSGPMVDSKIFICASASDRKNWMDNIEDRRYKSLRQQLSPSHSALAYLVNYE